MRYLDQFVFYIQKLARWQLCTKIWISVVKAMLTPFPGMEKCEISSLEVLLERFMESALKKRKKRYRTETVSCELVPN